jgi:D-glycero-D-manno-heptose 1,7-bisphosphate phosphatase
MKKAIFLDRDGVINNPKKNYYVYKPEDFSINIGVKETLKYFQQKGYLLIVISNQGGISKGKYSKQDVKRIHDLMEKEFAKDDISLAAVYYCPHHPKIENCLCRKPSPLMLEKTLARFEIDPLKSWFIGDRKTDIEAGSKAGLNTIKIRKNKDLRKLIPLIN